VGHFRGLSGSELRVDFGGEEGGVLPAEPEVDLRDDSCCESLSDLQDERQDDCDGDSRRDCRCGSQGEFGGDCGGGMDGHGGRNGQTRTTGHVGQPRSSHTHANLPERKAAAFAAAVQGYAPG
jgi:hypothetical protein